MNLLSFYADFRRLQNWNVFLLLYTLPTYLFFFPWHEGGSARHTTPPSHNIIFVWNPNYTLILLAAEKSSDTLRINNNHNSSRRTDIIFILLCNAHVRKILFTPMTVLKIFEKNLLTIGFMMVWVFSL